MATHHTRAVVVALDPSPMQEQLLRSYCGSSRKAYNWVLELVKDNLNTRVAEQKRGVDEADLTAVMSWSPYSLTPLWVKHQDELAPWHHDVVNYAFRSGITNATTALKNFNESKKGLRKGQRVGFPRFKSRRSKLSITFVETRNQDNWFSEDARHVRLLLPRWATDPLITRHREQLAWIHTTESVRQLGRLVAEKKATIQKVTISFVGGRWQAAFSVRYAEVPASRPVKRRGPLVGVDLGVKHLATLSQPVLGISDEAGHVANPKHLETALVRLARLNRRLARCQKGSSNRTKIVRQRQRLYGRVTKTRDLQLHRLTTTLAGSFDVVAIEDLYVRGMTVKRRSSSTRGLSRSILDASFSELRRQLTYKTADRGHALVVVERFFPSSKMCSNCGETRTKLTLSDRVYECSNCGLSLDRDVNAARNIHREALRLLSITNTVAGNQLETLNAVSRHRETEAPTGVDAGTVTRAESSIHPREQLLSV
jgi:putative transposase